MTDWNFLTNYAHILILLARDGTLRIRDLAAKTNITERAVQRIIADLVEAGYLAKSKTGRRNSYKVNFSNSAQHRVPYSFDAQACERVCSTKQMTKQLIQGKEEIDGTHGR